MVQSFHDGTEMESQRLAAEFEEKYPMRLTNWRWNATILDNDFLLAMFEAILVQLRVEISFLVVRSRALVNVAGTNLWFRNQRF